MEVQGCGVDFSQLESLVQESLLALKSANPDHQTGYEETDRSFVRRMVERHNMTLRRTGEIPNGGFLINSLIVNNAKYF